MKLINLDIATPEKKVFSGKVREIIAPGIKGEFGVLPDHAPFSTVLSPGVVEIIYEDGKKHHFQPCFPRVLLKLFMRMGKKNYLL